MANPWKNQTEFNGNPPEGISDPSRATREFSGELYVVGASQPGVTSPYDVNQNNAAGRPASPGDIWGIKTQSSHFGGKII